jgi:hypothetical protein
MASMSRTFGPLGGCRENEAIAASFDGPEETLLHELDHPKPPFLETLVGRQTRPEARIADLQNETARHHSARRPFARLNPEGARVIHLPLCQIRFSHAFRIEFPRIRYAQDPAPLVFKYRDKLSFVVGAGIGAKK